MSTSARQVFGRSDQYHTSPDIPVYWAYRPPILRSLCFHLAFLGGLLRRSRHLAVRGKFDEEAHAAAGLTYLRHVERAGGKFHVAGLDCLDRTSEPVVVAGNHMSFCETFVLAAMVGARKHKISFIIKESLARYPLFGPVVSSTHPILVTRKNPREDLKRVMKLGAEALAQGRSVIVFPQNRRRLTFRASEFNSIGAKLARRAQVPLVPMALRTDFLLPGRIFLDFGPIKPERPLYFEFGPALSPTGQSKDTHRQTVAFIVDRLRKWGVPVAE